MLYGGNDLGAFLLDEKQFEEFFGLNIVKTSARTKEGLEEIPAKGEKFDPFKHEALMVANDENVENGYIIDELMKGYTLKGKVIKYSKVRVCKK